MNDARLAYVWLRNAGLVVLLVGAAALTYYGFALHKEVAGATPRLDGDPGPLREVLAFPWSDYPSIPDVEKNKLDELIPIDAPLRLSDVRPWLTNPKDPLLGGKEAPRNADLQEALSIMSNIASKRSQGDEGMTADLTADDGHGDVSRAKEHFLGAERTGSRALQWLISYDRGVLYLWQGNRQKAAKELKDAYASLKPRLDGSSSPEVLSAGIHVSYALGTSLMESAGQAAKSEHTASGDAISHLRDAVVLSVRLFASGRPQGVAHAAEFFELEPTHLSTRALRNDLIAAYLLAPADYQPCKEAMTEASCSHVNMSGRGLCNYRDKMFCQTKEKVSNRLSDVYQAGLDQYIHKQIPEGKMWALQSVAELEAENALDQDPEVSYNVAHLLLTLKRPDRAYAYIAPVTAQGDQKRVTEAMERLTFVTSILAGEKPTAMSEGDPNGGDQAISEYRIAYQELYKDQNQPEPFRPLRVGNAQKTKSLDAWLFIRRYRFLLERGRFETFLAEHRTVMKKNVPTDFLESWKKAVVGEFLQRVSKLRSAGQPDAAAFIDAFVSRKDLFTPEELKAAGFSSPFWSPGRSAMMRWLGLFLLWVLFMVAVLWLCAAYRWTFLSAYRRDREAAARVHEDPA